MGILWIHRAMLLLPLLRNVSIASELLLHQGYRPRPTTSHPPHNNPRFPSFSSLHLTSPHILKPHLSLKRRIPRTIHFRQQRNFPLRLPLISFHPPPHLARIAPVANGVVAVPDLVELRARCLGVLGEGDEILTQAKTESATPLTNTKTHASNESPAANRHEKPPEAQVMRRGRRRRRRRGWTNLNSPPNLPSKNIPT